MHTCSFNDVVLLGEGVTGVTSDLPRSELVVEALSEEAPTFEPTTLDQA